MRRGVTLIELIFVIVIISFLAAGSFKAMQAILVREYKAKQQTNLSLESQIVVNQISNYLKDRIVYSTIGYDPSDGSFEYIGDLIDSKPVLEWIGRDSDDYLDKQYSGFFDMATKNGKKVASYGISNDINTSKVALIFSGSFDRSQSDSGGVNSSFGWHGSDRNDTFDITIPNNEHNISINNPRPKFIYEKYFLVNSAYAIARGADIDQNANCITNLNLKAKDINNTLFFFSNYRPWKGETFCADNNGTKAGNVSVLMQNIDGFNFSEVDYTIRILLDVNKTIRGANPVHFSKMKVVF